MAFTLIRDGKTLVRYLEGPTVLGEVLNDDEHDQLSSGNLAAFTESGGLMSLSSPLKQGQTIYLRPLQPEKDLQGFAFPINRARETVGISELLAIRKYEENHQTELYAFSLAEIRARLQHDPRSKEDLFLQQFRQSPKPTQDQILQLLNQEGHRTSDTRRISASAEPVKRNPTPSAAHYPTIARPLFKRP